MGIIIKKGISIILLITTILSLFSCSLFSNSLEDFFSEWEPEVDRSIAIIGIEYKEEIFYNGEHIKFGHILEEYYGREPVLLKDSYLAVYNGNLYVAYKYGSNDNNYGYTIDICSINLTDLKLEVLYTGMFSPKNIPDNVFPKSTSPEIYYSNLNAYIFDGVSMTIFNLETKEIQKLEICNFEIPSTEKYRVEYLKDDKGWRDPSGIKIIGDSFERLITFDYMAQRNPYVNKLKELKTEPTYFERIFKLTMPLDKFFGEAQCFDDMVYIRCCVFDEDGEENALIFSYNCSTDSFAFIYHTFSSSNPDSFVIPVEPRK